MAVGPLLLPDSSLGLVSRRCVLASLLKADTACILGSCMLTCISGEWQSILSSHKGTRQLAALALRIYATTINIMSFAAKQLCIITGSTPPAKLSRNDSESRNSAMTHFRWDPTDVRMCNR